MNIKLTSLNKFQLFIQLNKIMFDIITDGNSNKLNLIIFDIGEGVRNEK